MAFEDRGGGKPAEAGRWRRTRGVAAMVLPVGVGAFAVAALTRRGHRDQILWADLGVYTLVFLSAALLLVTAPTDGGPGSRRGWRWIGLAVVSGAVGNLVSSVVLRASGQLGGLTLADVFYLARYPLAYLGFVELVRARVRRGQAGGQAGQVFDGLVMGLGAAAAVMALELDGVLNLHGASRAEIGVNLAYPVGDLLLLLLLATGGVLVGRGAGWGGLLLAGGLVLTAAADVVYLVVDASGSYVEGGGVDLLWLSGAAVLGAAGYLGGRPPAAVRGASISLLSLVPPIAFVVVCAAVVGGQQAGLVSRPAALLADGGLLAALVRAGLTIRELRRLKAHEVAQLHRLARTDDLTGLPNRRALREHCHRLLRDGGGGGALCLLVLDVDRFKDINDSLGHPFGDRLLCELSDRMTGVLRPGDLLGRLGGDEFAVLVPGELAEAQELADAVLGALAEPFALGDMRLHVDVSIGLAAAVEPHLHPSDLLRLADLAMYRAKREHLSCCVYEQDDEAGRDRLQLTEQLRAALRGDDPRRNGTLLVYVQPQILLGGPAAEDGRRVVGVEALVRWQHPAEGLLLPGLFLPLAESAGLLSQVADVVLDAALDACRLWWDAGHEVPVSVNVAASDVLDPSLLDRLAAALRRHDLPPRALVLELTEDSLLVDPQRARDVLGAVRALGVAVSIDDYGSGYSSLAYLRDLPVDELKLDRAFVQDLLDEVPASPRAAAIVRTTADLAHSLGLRLVVEGVEREAALGLLAELGADVGQGFHLAVPMPPGRFVSWLGSTDPSRTTVAGPGS